MDVGAQMLYVLSRMIPDPLTLSRSSSELVNVFYVDTQRIAARDSAYSQQSDPSIKTKRGGCSQNDLMSVHRANWIISSIISFSRVCGNCSMLTRPIVRDVKVMYTYIRFVETLLSWILFAACEVSGRMFHIWSMSC